MLLAPFLLRSSEAKGGQHDQPEVNPADGAACDPEPDR